MSTYLQQQIQSRMQAKKLAIYALEKQAGLKQNAVWNILRGYSKNPRAESLKAIAEALACTIDDLVGPATENSAKISLTKAIVPSSGSYKWDENLYADAMKLISKSIADKKLDLKLEQVVALINEVYKYSIAKSSDEADKDYVNWILRSF